MAHFLTKDDFVKHTLLSQFVYNKFNPFFLLVNNILVLVYIFFFSYFYFILKPVHNDHYIYITLCSRTKLPMIQFTQSEKNMVFIEYVTIYSKNTDYRIFKCKCPPFSIQPTYCHKGWTPHFSETVGPITHNFGHFAQCNTTNTQNDFLPPYIVLFLNFFFC